MAPRSSWVKQEDQYLLTLVKDIKNRRWNNLTKKFNAMFPRRNRTSKQLRERYKNYLQFDDQNQLILQWTPEQVATMFQFYKNHGPKWTYCSSIMKGKSESALKNKFYSLMRKFVRKISFLRKNLFHKFSKPIKYESVIRTLDINPQSCCLCEQMYNQAEWLKAKIISLCQVDIQQVEREQIIQFSNRFFNFNYSTRFFRVRKIQTKKKFQPTETEENCKNSLQSKSLSQVQPVKKEEPQNLMGGFPIIYNPDAPKVKQEENQQHFCPSNKKQENIQLMWNQSPFFFNNQPPMIFPSLLQTFQMGMELNLPQLMSFYKCT